MTARVFRKRQGETEEVILISNSIRRFVTNASRLIKVEHDLRPLSVAGRLLREKADWTVDGERLSDHEVAARLPDVT